MKHILKFFFILIMMFPTTAFAETTYLNGCTASGQCKNGKICVRSEIPNLESGDLDILISAGNEICGGGEGQAVLGTVKPPTAISKLNFMARNNSSDGTGVGIGLVLFLSRFLQLGTIIAGLWVMFNVIAAAFIYITKPSSDDGLTAVKEKLTMSAVGLSFIVGAFAIAGIVGLIFFGDAGYILNPQLMGALNSTVVSP